MRSGKDIDMSVICFETEMKDVRCAQRSVHERNRTERLASRGQVATDFKHKSDSSLHL